MSKQLAIAPGYAIPVIPDVSSAYLHLILPGGTRWVPMSNLSGWGLDVARLLCAHPGTCLPPGWSVMPLQGRMDCGLALVLPNGEVCEFWTPTSAARRFHLDQLLDVLTTPTEA